MISLSLFKSFLMAIIIFIGLKEYIIFCVDKNFVNMSMVFLKCLKRERMRMTRPFILILRIGKESISKLSYGLIANISIPSISMQFENFDITKGVKDFLAKWQCSSDFAHQYQLINDLLHTRQELGQFNVEFHAQISFIWDQLALLEPKLSHSEDILLFNNYCNSIQLTQFLMILRDDFKLVRASILHQTPLPFIDTTLVELKSKKTCLCTMHF